MSIEEILRLLPALREHGVTHFKERDLEIQLGSVPRGTTLPLTSGYMQAGSFAPLPAGSLQNQVAPPAQAAPPVELEIPHHVNEVAGLLKLSDEDLVDKLFPDFSQDHAHGGIPHGNA